MPMLTLVPRATATSLLALAMLATAVPNAHAINLVIDAGLSSVTYTPGGFSFCDPAGNCDPSPQPQTFAVSGSFDLVQETVFVTTSFFPLDGYDREQIRFENVAVDSGGAATLGFSFPNYFAVLTGELFAADENPCSWFPSTGSCFSMGPFGNYSGMFDGMTLSMAGIDYAGDFFPSSFSFTLVARAENAPSVPEPSTLACLAASAIGLGLARRRRHSGNEVRPAEFGPGTTR